jgi:hypothetical protein
MPYTLMGLDVLSFMRRYRVQLAYMGGAADTPPIDRCAAGPLPNSKEFPMGTQFRMSVKPAGADATIFIESFTGYETGVRYLPWQPDYCVYTRMDPAAGIVFTGPLTGCNIYVAGPRTDPVLFHTNSNTNADNAALNNTAKLTATLNMLGANVLGLPANTLVGGKLERASYSGNYLGFVFGLKENNDWKFYFNGIGAGSSTLRRIF